MTLYRRFATTDGQLVEALFTTEGEAFSTPAESHAADLAAVLGVGGLKVIEGEDDPWDGKAELVPVPAPQAPPDDPDVGIVLNVLAKNADDVTPEEVKSALLAQLRIEASRGG